MHPESVEKWMSVPEIQLCIVPTEHWNVPILFLSNCWVNIQTTLCAFSIYIRIRYPRAVETFVV